MRKTIVVTGCLALLTVRAAAGAVPTTASAGTAYHNAEFGFSLVEPAHWEEFPQDAVRAQDAQAKIDNPKLKSRMIAGFQPDFLRFPFSFPRFVVMVIPYAELGALAPTNDAELQHLATVMCTSQPTLVSTGSVGVRSRFALPPQGQTRSELDVAAGRLTLYQSSTSRHFGAIRSESVFYFGRTDIIHLSLAAPEQDWDQTVAPGRAVFNSFQFDVGKTRIRSTATPFGPSRSIGVATGVAVGSGVGGLFVVAALIAAFWRGQDTSDVHPT